MICKIHGIFEQLPYRHLKDNIGCQKCSGNLQKSNSDFISQAKQNHGELYDYSKTKYINNYTKVCIICKKHGEFWQNAFTHLTSGCPRCSCKVSKPCTEWLDSLNIPNTKDHREIRITINGKILIADGFMNNCFYEFWGDYWHGNPKIFEPEKYNKLAHKSFKQLYEETQQKRKLILDAGYKLVEIWESDWKKLQKDNKNKLKKGTT